MFNVIALKLKQEYLGLFKHLLITLNTISMKRINFSGTIHKVTLFSLLAFASMDADAQTNVFDDIIVPSANHSYLEAAILQEGLEGALQNNAADLTVFAPDNMAFDNLAAALGTDINGLLALPNLSDILLYHVLGTGVPAAAVTNGLTPTPLNPANTIKLTKTSMGGMVYANQAMVNAADLTADNGYVHSIDAVILPNETVVDVAIDNGFTSLTTAVVTAELLPALTDPLATLTVFAPTNQAFDDAAAALGTDINGLLALPNLADILTYHVLGSTVPSSGVAHGAIVQPISPTNTLKLTVTGGGQVYVNQAEVTAFDINSDNGVVHVLDAIVLPVETVVDVAIDNSFTSLATAVITAELMPALTDPFSQLTVFAPTDQAFDDAATALGTDINGLLALPNLADILTYHVLGSQVLSTGVTNGAVVQPLSTTNSLKLTVTGAGGVYVNQAEVTAVDITSDNGVVHVLDAVVLPSETAVDVALDNGFTSLASAVITAELMPALTDPFAELTVFAPTNQAFDNLAAALGTDLNGVLANPELADILLYHVVAGTVLSTDLTNGNVPTLNGQTITVDLSMGVMINASNVTSADLTVDNGVVHVIDEVLVPSLADLNENTEVKIGVYPNPASEMVSIDLNGNSFNEVLITDFNGKIVAQKAIENNVTNTIDVSSINAGSYILILKGNEQYATQNLQLVSGE